MDCAISAALLIDEFLFSNLSLVPLHNKTLKINTSEESLYQRQDIHILITLRNTKNDFGINTVCKYIVKRSFKKTVVYLFCISEWIQNNLNVISSSAEVLSICCITPRRAEVFSLYFCKHDGLYQPKTRLTPNCHSDLYIHTLIK